MRRNLILLLSFLLPVAVYFLYAQAMRMKRRDASMAAPESLWKEAPWPWLAVAGVLLMAAALAAVVFIEDGGSSGVYSPARMVDGKLIGGSIMPKDKP